VTGAAACAIAFRNAVFQVVPRVFVEQVRQQAMRAAVGDEKTLAARRQKALGYFAAHGVALERVLTRLSEGLEMPKKGIEDLTLEDIGTLHGFATSIRDGVATIEDLFPTAEKKQSAAAQIADELKAKRDKKEPTDPAFEPPVPE
jgi:hypothetical protein